VNPGDALGLKPTGGATFINLAAIACSATSQYSFGGFQSPVDDPPTVNIGTAGKSYLARFQLRDSSGAIVSSLSAVSSVASNRVDCATFGSQPTDVLEQSTTGKSSLWYSSTTHRYVYRWKTSTTPGCFQLLFTFRTGQTETALFKLK